MRAVEIARAEARARKVAVLEYLRGHGEATLREIMSAVSCSELEAQAALMRLTTVNVAACAAATCAAAAICAASSE